MHPRTKKNIDNFKMANRLKNYLIIEPLGYFDFISLVRRAKFILTDSGGVQAETTFLKIPCLTLREITEHQSTITHGTNILINPKTDIKQALARIKKRKYRLPKYWDGKTAGRIVNYLLKNNRMNYAS